MKFVISDQLDLQYEAVCLIERIASNSNDASSMYSGIDAYCAHYLSEYSLTDAEKSQIEALRVAGHRVAEKLTIPQEDLVQYFTPIPETDISLAYGLLILHNFGWKKRPDDSSLIRAIFDLLDLESELSSHQINSFHAFTALISELPFPAETKWACTDLFLNYDQRLARTMELITSAAELLKKEAAPLQEAVSMCAAQLREMDSEGGLDAKFREKGFTLDASNYFIHPCAMRFSAISFFSDSLLSNRPASEESVIIRYGMLFDTLQAYVKEQRSESDELLRYAKALADKTRVQILFALRDAPLYAQDVVSLTGLSAATVSHHMNELASVGFVGFEKQGTRILYRLLPKKVERLAELLKTLVP